MNEMPSHESDPTKLNPEEINTLVERRRDFLVQLSALERNREASDETYHTVPPMINDAINENFVDRGWTSQIEEVQEEIRGIESKLGTKLNADSNQGSLEL
jgi:flagellar biosynthesis/type III secretory pathway chaperone